MDVQIPSIPVVQITLDIDSDRWLVTAEGPSSAYLLTEAIRRFGARRTDPSALVHEHGRTTIAHRHAADFASSANEAARALKLADWRIRYL
jgi:hypothetical protein